MEAASGNIWRPPPLPRRIIRRVPPVCQPQSPNPASPRSRSGPSGPTRARNYDKLIAAAREAFTEDGASASLEDIARRAGVGIGTLYRNFATRQELLEAVYVEEVETICRAAEEVDGADPWEALAAWLRRFAGYAATKKALVDGADGTTWTATRRGLHALPPARSAAAGEPLLEAAQRAGVVREDVHFMDVVRMVGGIATIPHAEPGQVDRILAVALDGLRRR